MLCGGFVGGVFGLFGRQPGKGLLEFTEGSELVASIGCAEFEKCRPIKVVFRTGQHCHPVIRGDTERAKIMPPDQSCLSDGSALPPGYQG